MQAPSQHSNGRLRFAREHIDNYVFYLPFAYYYQVRLGTIGKLLSWGLIYLLPTFFYSALMSGGLSWAFLLDYILLLVAVFSLYEVGYIFNDTFATQREEDPAIRLYSNNLDYFYRHYRLIFGVRIVPAICLLGCLLILHPTPLWLITTLLAVLILPLFLGYNLCRSRYNVFLYPLLVFSRYLPFVLPYATTGNAWNILWLFLSFPLLNALERFSMPRYRYPILRLLMPTEDSKSLFRVVYYTLLSGIATLIMVLLQEGILPLIPIYILGIYRIGVYLLTRFYHPKNYLQG